MVQLTYWSNHKGLPSNSRSLRHKHSHSNNLSVVNCVAVQVSTLSFLFTADIPKLIPQVSPLLYRLPGHSATIRFTVTGNPLLTSDLQWMHEGILINLTDQGRPPHLNFSTDKLTLTISSLKAGDNGTYTLTASNTAGSVNSSVLLYIGGKLITCAYIDWIINNASNNDFVV